MIWVVLGVCITAFCLGMYLMVERYIKVGGGFLVGASVICGVVACIVAVFLMVSNANLSVIDEKIAMYQEENTVIEEQISAVVKQYQEYESEIFEESAKNVEADIILASLYPELKSNTLVQSQIEMYVANNNKIKELREDKISGSVVRWWLYFGR